MRCATWMILTMVLTGGVACSSSSPGRATPSLNPTQLVSALRQGGYVLYLRHGFSDQSRADANPVDLENCDTQRILSEEGRRQALAIFRGIKRLQIPVGRVLASPYCRCMDTARLAFGRAEPDLDLITVDGATEPVKEQRLDALRALLTTPPATANTILVSHGGNLDALEGISLAEGEVAIFKPQAHGEPTLVGRMTAAQWATIPSKI